MEGERDREASAERPDAAVVEFLTDDLGDGDTPPVTSLSGVEINRLGDRLRESDISSSDLELLQRVRAEHFALLVDVQSEIQERLPDVVQTSRLKTVQTIVEKLRREPKMDLSRMQDIAGIRIVEDMNRAEQDVLASDILDAVGGGRLVDRRKNPRFGYRAVHLTVRRGQRSVEIQIRTSMQDQWAQIVERLGDTWGRQIRYGKGPSDSGRLILGNSKVTRLGLWELVQQVAAVVDAWEIEVVERLGEVPKEGEMDSVLVLSLIHI